MDTRLSLSPPTERLSTRLTFTQLKCSWQYHYSSITSCNLFFSPLFLSLIPFFSPNQASFYFYLFLLNRNPSSCRCSRPFLHSQRKSSTRLHPPSWISLHMVYLCTHTRTILKNEWIDIKTMVFVRGKKETTDRSDPQVHFLGGSVHFSKAVRF